MAAPVTPLKDWRLFIRMTSPQEKRKISVVVELRRRNKESVTDAPCGKLTKSDHSIAGTWA